MGRGGGQESAEPCAQVLPCVCTLRRHRSARACVCRVRLGEAVRDCGGRAGQVGTGEAGKKALLFTPPLVPVEFCVSV